MCIPNAAEIPDGNAIPLHVVFHSPQHGNLDPRNERYMCIIAVCSLFFPVSLDQDGDLSGTISLVMTQCCKRIKDTVQKLASDHKDIHSSVSRVGKAIDKVMIELLLLYQSVWYF